MSEAWYELHRQRAEAAFAAGDVEVALDVWRQAEAGAIRRGDSERADLAFCNQAAILIDLERGEDCLPRLKRILLGSGRPRARWMASYYTGMALYMATRLQDAMGYARRALSFANELGEDAPTAATNNLVGNIAVLDSRFDEAETAYRRALAAYEGLTGYHRSMASLVRDNLGYVLMCTDRLDSGIELCDVSRRELELQRALHLLPQPLQDLCYGHLLDGSLQEARRHGERGLELAMETDDRLVVKNTLFLLAEVAVREGDRFRARRFLSELVRCYPEVAPDEDIIDVFLDVDLTRVVNLRG
ncbi:MAG: hypothetical protein GXP47_00195 [Acidobacteria bacterium]|nr:hypothetical protein [Acidobacteriota bacterium]